jgi:S1-C subfamily serine protease
VSGPTVTKVRPRSAAQQAGLLPGDVVIAVDGQNTPDKESVQIRLGAKAWGDNLGLDILRGGQRRTLTVVLPTGPS